MGGRDYGVYGVWEVWPHASPVDNPGYGVYGVYGVWVFASPVDDRGYGVRRYGHLHRQWVIGAMVSMVSAGLATCIANGRSGYLQRVVGAIVSTVSEGMATCVNSK